MEYHFLTHSAIFFVNLTATFKSYFPSNSSISPLNKTAAGEDVEILTGNMTGIAEQGRSWKGIEFHLV